MSKESYIRGFCKAAEAKGVDPKALAKYAANINNVRQTGSVQPFMVNDATDMIEVPLTPEERKKRFFKHWYDYLNPGEYIAAGSARKLVPRPQKNKVPTKKTNPLTPSVTQTQTTRPQIVERQSNLQR